MSRGDRPVPDNSTDADMFFADSTTRYPAAALLASVMAAPFSTTLAAALGAGAVALAIFFRDPNREPPDSGYVAPADGRVSVIREEDDGRVRVGVFMNVHNVHVNRAPAPGPIHSVTRHDGGYVPAFDKDAERNERVTFEVGDTTVILIAGVLVRRIHPYVAAGDTLDRGERLGHISFGSRADVILPERYSREDVAVSRGQSVRAGETLLVE